LGPHVLDYFLSEISNVKNLRSTPVGRKAQTRQSHERIPAACLVRRGALLRCAIGTRCETCSEIVNSLTEKRAYLERVAKDLNANLPPEVAQSFDAAVLGNWISASNLYENLKLKYGPNVPQSAIPRELWFVLQEAAGSSEVLGFWDPKYTRQFAEEIFKVVPANAVYFGGTDAGRNIITVFSTSHQRGQPFFT
jgi:hypothetical protein